MEKLKELLTSERGMQAVNILFFLGLLMKGSGISLLAYLLWAVYLGYGIKNTPSKVVRVIYALFLLFAVVMVLDGLIALGERN